MRFSKVEIGSEAAKRVDAPQEYNTTIIIACNEHGIEIIGATDHDRVKNSLGMVKSVREAGLFALSGFDAVARGGGITCCEVRKPMSLDFSLFFHPSTVLKFAVRFERRQQNRDHAGL